MNTATAAQPKKGDASAVNVQVILRCRPCSSEEVVARMPQIVQVNEAAREVVLMQSVAGKQMGRAFHYDKVFGTDSTQERLYDGAVSPIVSEVLDGFNCTIFAYGQTGTGKTYTMEGGDRNSVDGENLSEVAGVIPRAIHQIFSHLDSINSEYTVKCSFLELYNEETTDLLAVGDSKAGQKLRMLEDKSGVVVQGLEEIIVKSSADIYTLLDRGSAKRRTAETLLNKQSSRSHSVFCITVHMRETAPDGEEVIKIGKLYLVDLAGSENISRSGAVDVRAKEAGLINKSLLTLGRVITALVEQSGHIPYRDSKLTRLLRDSLGGRTKTCIIATIAPTVQCQEETLSTLDYAHRAKNIRNRPEVNQRISKTAHIKELNGEIDKLKAELYATREKNGVYLPSDQYDAQMEDQKFLSQRVEGLQAELEVFAERSRQESAQLTIELQGTQQELQTTQLALRRARVAIQERDFLLATHERSESALASHSVNLCGELERTAAELGDLHGRLQETADRDEANAALVQHLKAEADSRLHALQEAVTAAVGQQQQESSTIGSAVAEFLQQKDADLQALKAQMAQLQGQLQDVGALVASHTETAARAATDGLAGVDGLQRTYASEAHQAAEAAAAAAAESFAALTGSLQTQRQQLEAHAVAHQAASDALLARAAGAVAVARQRLQAADHVAAECRNSVESTVQAQQQQLAAFEESFAAGMQREQEGLVQQIAALLGDFSQRKHQEVAAAVAGLRSSLVVGGSAAAGHFDRLQQMSVATVEQLQAEEVSAGTTAAQALEQLQGSHSSIVGCLDAAAAQGESLRATSDSNHAARAGQLQEHTVAMARALGDMTSAVNNAGQQAQQQCCAALRTVAEGQQQMATGVLSRHEQEAAALSSIAAAAKRGAEQADVFKKAQHEGLTALNAHVADVTGGRYAVSDEMLPELRELQVPPVSWIHDMRTPPLHIILAEFHRQMGHSTRSEGESEGAATQWAEGKPRTSPTSVVDQTPSTGPASPRTENSAASSGHQPQAAASAGAEDARKFMEASENMLPESKSPSRIKAVFEQSTRQS